MSTNQITAYPLQWPIGQKRTMGPKISDFKVQTFETARSALTSELKRLGARDVILSTNIPIRQDGYPYASAARPINIQDYVALSKSFTKRHGKCKPREKE